MAVSPQEEQPAPTPEDEAAEAASKAKVDILTASACVFHAINSSIIGVSVTENGTLPADAVFSGLLMALRRATLMAERDPRRVAAAWLTLMDDVTLAPKELH